MASHRLKWHLFFRAVTLHRQLQMVELPIEGENATTGARRKTDALLQQGRMDTIRSQFRVLLKLLYRLHRFQIGLEGQPFTRMGFVLQTSELLFGPASERGMNSLPRGAQ